MKLRKPGVEAPKRGRSTLSVPANPAARVPVREPSRNRSVDRRVSRLAESRERRPYRNTSTSSVRVRAARGYIVRAPSAKGRALAEIDLIAADERMLAGLFGDVRLVVTPEAVDLERLRLGLLNLAVDHDTTRLAGYIESVRISNRTMYATAQIANTDEGRRILKDLDAGMRRGFSPGFLFSETRPIPASDPAYDPDADLQIEISKYSIYEISSTAVPRNPNARLQRITKRRGNASMQGDIRRMELVSPDDPIGMTLAVARSVVESGEGPAAKVEKLRSFLSAYDEQPETLSRESRAVEAARRAGIRLNTKPTFGFTPARVRS